MPTFRGKSGVRTSRVMDRSQRSFNAEKPAVAARRIPLKTCAFERSETGAVGSWWSDRPSRTHRAFGCQFQTTRFEESEGNYIRLRSHARFFGVRPKRRSRGACPRGISRTDVHAVPSAATRYRNGVEFAGVGVEGIALLSSPRKRHSVEEGGYRQTTILIGVLA